MPQGSRRGGPSPGPGASTAGGGAVDVPRLMRAAMFAAVCVTTTSLGHALMSGDTLPWWAIAYAFAGTVSGAWWLTGRERGAAAVVGATVVAQGLLHLLFALAHQLAHAPDAASLHMDTAMHHSGSMGMPSASMTMPSGSPLASGLPRLGSTGMLLAHLLAAAVCGLWLWRGETAAHRIGGALAAVVFAPLRRVCRVLFRTVPEPGPSSCGPASGGEERCRPTPASLRYAVVRRGPPPGLFGSQPPVSLPIPARRRTVIPV
ncbi:MULTISPECIES: hypothetical protein [unclassified Streptomyces]|uniref:hypothetical protein n=1 Tax=unclassified Streptomyces TaxID=2593676 RepID=UPI002E2B12EC|nr:hypothetical protein [Streptomyces sp. NBC_00228]WSW96362.1 hypothetical protein OG714_44060 [Streptomyces sp. NBC_00989]